MELLDSRHLRAFQELARQGRAELRSIALAKGMRSLHDDGLRLVREGTTTLEEVMRVARI